MCCLGLIYAYFRIPETKDRTFLELDHMFAIKLPARKFKGYHVDLAEISADDKAEMKPSTAEMERVQSLR
jgi:SP family general alpha glucoside:H+ symporter-like MFS transporter